MATFYMVYLEGERTPTFRHVTMDSAEQEAKRLAETHGKKAYVLATIKSFENTKFKVEDCRPPIDLPF